MDKMTHPQQLSLSFDVSPLQSALSEAYHNSKIATPEVVHPSSFAPLSGHIPDAAKIIDFQFEASKREAMNQASLYRQILNSVRHIS